MLLHSVWHMIHLFPIYRTLVKLHVSSMSLSSVRSIVSTCVFLILLQSVCMCCNCRTMLSSFCFRQISDKELKLHTLLWFGSQSETNLDFFLWVLLVFFFIWSSFLSRSFLPLTVQCTKLLLVLASTVVLGIGPRRDPRLYFCSSQTFTYFEMGAPLRREEGSDYC
jgi:hypothetical protein